VGDAAGEAADRFHLLQLHHRRLHPFALDDFVHQAVVGLRQRAGALVDARFQRFVQVYQRFLALAQAGGGALAVEQHVARLVLAPARAQARQGGAAQRLRVQRALEQDHVAQFSQTGAGAVGRHPYKPRQQHDEGEVRPVFLGVEPGAQARGVHALQRFLGEDGGARAGGDAGGEIVEAVDHGAAETVARQYRAHDLRVASVGREDQDALVASGAGVSLRHAFWRPSSASSHGNSAGR